MNLVTRESAKAQGLKRFYTGDACPKGHDSPRYVSDGSCCQCRKEKILEKRKDPEFRAKEVRRELDKRRDDPEYKKRRNKASLDWFLRKHQDAEFVESQKSKNRQWYQEGGGKEWANAYRKKRMMNDPLFVVKSRIRSRVKEAFRNNGFTKRSKTSEILGCSFEYFKAHIERQFHSGMSWDNRDKWHIDHIVPLATAKSEDDVILLSHFTNLRPMWAIENREKSDKSHFLL